MDFLQISLAFFVSSFLVMQHGCDGQMSCYQCYGTSLISADCLDDEKVKSLDSMKKENCAGCSVGVAVSKVVKPVTFVDRRCIPINTPVPTGCRNETIKGIKGNVCYCKEEFCNGDTPDSIAGSDVTRRNVVLMLITSAMIYISV